MGYNVFADMGFENPEEELLKSEIVTSLRHLVDEKHLKLTQVAQQWNMNPAAVAELLRGHRGDYLGRLFGGRPNAVRGRPDPQRPYSP